MYSPIVKKLHLAIRDVLHHLRGGKGYNEKSFNELFTALQACEESWKSCEEIPKSAVSLLVDLQCIIGNSAYPYPGEEGEKIRRASSKVGELISRIAPWQGPPI